MGATYADRKGHVIVCGLRGVGLRIVEQLTLSGVPAVVVDDDPDPPLARLIGSWDVPLISASTRAAETMTSAGLPGAIAVICAQHDDLRTLETALLTRRLRTDVRVVAQITNPAVGRAVKQVGVSVLDVAGLSAPSVVEACLGAGVQDMTLSGMRFLAARTTAPRAGSLRELYGALAPIAVVPAGGGDVTVCPGRDTPVRAGDEVTLIGTPAELRAASVLIYPERTGAAVLPSSPRPRRAARRLRDLAVSLASAADRRLAVALGALVGVLVAASGVLRTPGGGLHGLTMRDLGTRTRVLAIRRAAQTAILEHPVRRSTRFQSADEAYLIGPYDELLTVLRRDRPAPAARDDITRHGNR